MTGQEIESIVDKLADKLGVAVGKVEPIMQQVIDEFVLYNLVIGILCILSAIMMVAVGLFLFRRGSNWYRKKTIIRIAESVISKSNYLEGKITIENIFDSIERSLDPYISDDWKVAYSLIGVSVLIFSCIPFFVSFGYFANAMTPVANIFFRVL